MASSSNTPVSSQSQSQVPSAPVSSSPSAPLAPIPMYKNQLQEFAQRSGIAVPVYETVNGGHQHVPKFRSTVTVDGVTFTSKLTFMQRKAAEQETARIALEGITKKVREEVRSFALKNAVFSKAIMNEYAAKLNKEKPTFNTVRHEAGVYPIFVSYLTFNGTTYSGDASRNKKDAEQSAAHTALLSILGNPDSGLMIFQMIKSKSKSYDGFKTKSLQPVVSSGVLRIANTADSSIVMDHKAAGSSVVINHKDKEVTDPVGVTNNNEVVKVEIPKSCAVLPTCQQSQIPKQEPVPEATNPVVVSQQCQIPKQEPVPEATNPLVVSQQPALSLPIEDGSALPIECGSSSKKRRKNNRKANKKARLEAELPPVPVVPVNQAPPCSVAL